VAEPYAAAYAMTKYATAAFSDVLRLEMKKFDVCVAVIEPGDFADTTESVNVSLSFVNLFFSSTGIQLRGMPKTQENSFYMMNCESRNPMT
jgi:short-subunit dehydrogenase